MGDMKLRCHFSIIFESLWQFWIVIFLMFFNQLDAIIDVIKSIGTGGLRGLIDAGGLWGLLGVTLLTAIILTVQYLRWRKTWIIIEDNLVIIERNTLRKYKNNIAIENISAVNMERNLFERIVGTYRIKMDTSSMTTANETDVSIVFREDMAIEFRRTILERMSVLKGNGEKTSLAEERQPDQVFETTAEEGRTVFHYNTKDMLAHTFYSMPLFSLIISLSGIAASIWYISNVGLSTFVQETIGGFIAVALLVIGSMYNVVKRFITYYDFTVYRDGGDLHVRCGLIKLRSYTIPVDKITALEVEQPPFARIFKRYSVKVVTVGIGDEDGESSNITMSLTKEKLKKQFEELVPEYQWGDIEAIIPEEKGGALVRLVQSIKWHIITIGCAVALVLTTELNLWIAVGIPLFVDAYINLLYFVSHKTAGYHITDKGVVISKGYFKKTYTICTYKKMQILTMEYHPLARHLGIGSGSINLLNDVKLVPYINKEVAFKISDNIIGGTK